VSDAAFQRVTELIEETEELMEEIANTEDGKHAQDLQNRLTGQTHLLMAEMIRVQSTQSATQARNQLYQEARLKEDQKRGVVQSFEDFFSNQVNENN